MSATGVYHPGLAAKKSFANDIAQAEFLAQSSNFWEGEHIKHFTKYVEKSADWQRWIDLADVLKSVTGLSDIATLKRGIIIALALIHGKSKAELAVKLSALAAFGEEDLINEYTAVLTKAGKKTIDGLDIQATLRNFEIASEAAAVKAVEALKMVLKKLPEVNQRLKTVSSDSAQEAAFRTWFGDPKITYQKVAGNFAVMADAVKNRHVILSFDGTGCQDPQKGGYVYPGKTTAQQLCNIHLCRKIFLDDPTADRIAATIMHELSHAAANTDDVNGLVSYGESICQELAIEDPEKAANNADNYRWYAFPDVKN